MLVCTLGDLLLDVIVRASGPLAPGADTPVATRLATGGQAANVASWVVALGEEARFVGKLADDPAGELARSLLERRGVEVAGPLAEGASGVVVAFGGPDGERSMATEPEWELVGGAYGLAETAVVKRGARGVAVLSESDSEEYPPLGAEVVDTTGAGDALAAGFLVGGIELGLEAAARCVAQVGAVPM